MALSLIDLKFAIAILLASVESGESYRFFATTNLILLIMEEREGKIGNAFSEFYSDLLEGKVVWDNDAMELALCAMPIHIRYVEG